MPTAKEEKSIPPSTLHRSATDRMIGGVCGGFGKYFQIDPTILRILFILTTVFGGWGLFLYLILWLIIPSESSPGLSSSETIRMNTQEMRTRAKTIAHDLRVKRNGNGRPLWAVVIILIGIIFLLRNLGIFDIFSLQDFWPIVLIILGLVIIFK